MTRRNSVLAALMLGLPLLTAPGPASAVPVRPLAAAPSAPGALVTEVQYSDSHGSTHHHHHHHHSQHHHHTDEHHDGSYDRHD